MIKLLIACFLYCIFSHIDQTKASQSIFYINKNSKDTIGFYQIYHNKAFLDSFIEYERGKTIEVENAQITDYIEVYYYACGSRRAIKDVTILNKHHKVVLQIKKPENDFDNRIPLKFLIESKDSLFLIYDSKNFNSPLFILKLK